MTSIWVDYMAPCDVFFFKSSLADLCDKPNYLIHATARRHAETLGLLEKNNMDAIAVGGHNTSTPAAQIVSLSDRVIRLMGCVPRFDVSYSLANIYAILVSQLRGCPCISVIDNDLIEYGRTRLEKTAARIHAKATWIIAPSVYPIQLTVSNGGDHNRIVTFDGYKEDIYIADYAPDAAARSEIPFEEFVVLRPEALYSTYVHGTRSIVRDILRQLSLAGIDVVYLPRHSADLTHMRHLPDSKAVWVPQAPVNGLDLVYYSRGVLTGSGTFAREAACMGQIAVSFFPDRLLAVDRSLIDSGRMFHSRNPTEIAEYIESESSRKRSLSMENSKTVKKEFVKSFSRILEVLDERNCN